jgi:hypothetical protein
MEDDGWPKQLCHREVEGLMVLKACLGGLAFKG